MIHPDTELRFISHEIGHGVVATRLIPCGTITWVRDDFDFELAVRDILPGEELTDDYGTLNLDDYFDCRCGWADCRRVIRPDDMLRHADEWDAVVAGAFPMIGAVAQPLWPLLKEAPEVRLALSGLVAIASCRLNYCRAELAAV